MSYYYVVDNIWVDIHNSNLSITLEKKISGLLFSKRFEVSEELLHNTEYTIREKMMDKLVNDFQKEIKLKLQ